MLVGATDLGTGSDTVLAQMAAEGLANDWVVSTVGVGHDFNEHLMTTLADHGHYVEPRFSADGSRLVYRKITGGYLLWVGAHAPGGAFQSGALLAAAAVLLRLGGQPAAGLPAPVLQRWLLVGGVGVFITVGLLVSFSGQAFLQYPQGWSGTLILLIETAATLSIATTLALAYIGGTLPAGQGGFANKEADMPGNK